MKKISKQRKMNLKTDKDCQPWNLRYYDMVGSLNKEEYLKKHLEHKKLVRKFYEDVKLGKLSSNSVYAKLFSSEEKAYQQIHTMYLIDENLFRNEIASSNNFYIE